MHRCGLAALAYEIRMCKRVHVQGVKLSFLSVICLSLSSQESPDSHIQASERRIKLSMSAKKLPSLCFESFGKAHEHHKYCVFVGHDFRPCDFCSRTIVQYSPMIMCRPTVHNVSRCGTMHLELPSSVGFLARYTVFEGGPLRQQLQQGCDIIIICHYSTSVHAHLLHVHLVWA